MKKKKLYGFMIALVITVCMVAIPKVMAADNYVWSTVGTIGFDSANYTSIAFDSNNMPYVAYNHTGLDGEANVRRYNGSYWEIIGAANFSSDKADYIMLAIDGNNIPYVAYRDRAAYSGYSVTVKKYTPSGWVYVGLMGFSECESEYISLVIDSNGIPYVAYYNTDSSRAVVKKFNGASWETVGDTNTLLARKNNISLVLDSNNIPYLSCSDASNGNKVTVLKYNGTSWETVGVAGFSLSAATEASLAFDYNDNLYAVYSGFDSVSTLPDKTTVMKYNGTSWELVGNANFSAGITFSNEISFNKNNKPYVVYYDHYNNGRATVMTFNGTTWEAVANVGFTHRKAQNLSMAIDSNGMPYVSYMDGYYRGSITVMKLSTTYNVEFNGNGNDEGLMSNQLLIHDAKSKLVANGYTKNGYSFIGWSTSADGNVIYTNSQEVTNLTLGENITLYAIWEANEYTVMFDGNDAVSGSINNQSFTYDIAQNLTVNAFLKTGYTFTGWSTSVDGDVIYTDAQEVTNLIASGNITLYAIWEANQYTVMFDGNQALSGSINNQIFTYDTAQNLTVNAFLKTGYTFIGWSISANGDVIYIDAQEVTNLMASGNITLYAIWEANRYTVIFDGNQALSGAINNQIFTYDIAQNLTVNSFLKTGYTFTGWSTSTDGEPDYVNEQELINLLANGNMTLYAVWSANGYTVTFDGNGETSGSINNQIFTYDTAQNLTANGFLKTGYTFMGWSTSTDGVLVYVNEQEAINLAVNGNVRLYVVWNANGYTVTFDGNGETSGTINNQSYVYDVSQNLTINKFIKSGYTFMGWSTSTDGELVYVNEQELINVAVNGNVRLYAVWNANGYTVIYKGNGATNGSMGSQSFVYDRIQNLTINSYTKTGYTFMGWSTSTNGDAFYKNEQRCINLSASGSITLYAIWSANEYAVTFDGNDAISGSITNQTYVYDQAQNLSENTYIKTGYTFKGWSTSIDGDAIYTDKEEVTNLILNGNVVLFAVWDASSYTVSFDGNRETSGLLKSQSFKYDEKQKLIANGFKKTGYTFTGWARSSDGDVIYVNEQELLNATKSEDITLYAVWEANGYTVTFDGNGETRGSINNQIFTYDTAQKLATNNYKKTGHTFKGWARSSDGDVIYVNEQELLNATKSEDITLYAVWEANGYTVMFDSNGADSGTTDSISFIYDEKQNLTSNGFVKTGYTFMGWSTSSDGEAVYLNEQEVNNVTISQNIVLYANWKKIIPTGISFVNDKVTINLFASDLVTNYCPITIEASEALNQSVTWESSNPKVVSIDRVNGIIKANAVGRSVITVKNATLQSDTMIVDVIDPTILEKNVRMGNIFGRIINASGEPISGYTINLYSTVKTRITDTNGAFEFTNVDFTEHTLVIVNDEIELGRYVFEFEEGTKESYTETEDVIRITNKEDTMVVDLMFEVNSDNQGIKLVDLNFSQDLDITKADTNEEQSNIWWIVVLSLSLTAVAIVFGKKYLFSK